MPSSFSLSPFSSQTTLLVYSIALRIILFSYGLYQDAHFPAKYTDIDYFVFTDAARFVSQGGSPYERATYRYTPILAWLLLPTSWKGGLWFSFGKGLFAAADIHAGWLLIKILRKHRRMDESRALKYASGWLLNPMVAVISTRGSSEGLMGVIVVALLWAALERRVALAGVLLGLGVHLKIYPFIYGISILCFLDEGVKGPRLSFSRPSDLLKLVNKSRVQLLLTSLTVFMVLNAVMYGIYGFEFLQHTYLHHLTRVDHRHNFSPYNLLLYLSSATPNEAKMGISIETVAFLPQFILVTMLFPLIISQTDLAGCMFAQTYAFVTFNKVCTSQYFEWYIVLLPLYLPYSTFIGVPVIAVLAMATWISAQVVWLQAAFNLEFLGESTFTPTLFLSNLTYYAINTWIIGLIVRDVGLLRRMGEWKTAWEYDG